MRSLMIIVVYELFKPFADACPTVHPRVMEPVNSRLEGVKPLSDQVSIGIINQIVQPNRERAVRYPN